MPSMDNPSSDSNMDPVDDVEVDDFIAEDFEEYVEEGSSNSQSIDDDDDGDSDDIDDLNLLTSEGEPVKDDADNVFLNHTGAVFCCHLDPKSNTLAVTGSEDDKAYVWNISTGEVLFECGNHNDSVVAAEFSHDGTYVATGDMSGFIQVRKVATKCVIWNDSIGDLSWLKWHHGTTVLFAAAASGEVYMWKIPSGVAKLFPSHGVASDCGVIMPDGRRATFGYSDGSMRVYDLKSCATLASIAAGEYHNFTVYCMDTHSDNNMIVTGGGDGKVVLFKTQPGKIVTTFEEAKLESDAVDHNGWSWVEAVQFCSDPSLPYVAAGTLSGRLLIWDIAKQALRNSIELNSGISRLVWDKHSTAVYAGLLDGSVKIYDGRSGTFRTQLQGHRNNILDLSLSNDGSVLLTASEDKTARIFTLSTPDR